MAGRHRAPVDHKVARVATAAATGTALLATPASALAATVPTDEALDLIAECETGGRNVMNYINDSMHTASGFWQITNSTWRANDGTEFAPTAMQASADQQRIVAKRVALNGQPDLGDWNESRHCWGSRMPAALRGEDVTDVHPGGRGAPAPPPAPAPAPDSAPAPPPTGDSAALTYTARQGDTLSRIAAANGTTVAALASLNGLADPDRIFAGQVIRLTGTPTSSPVTYTVEKGDVLWKIAQKTGTTTNDLVTINQLPDGDAIFPGQVLKLGGQGVLTPDAVPGIRLIQNAARWTPQAALAISEVSARYNINDVATRNGHLPAPNRAADVMTMTDVATQKEMAEWLIRPENRDRLGLEYVISRQRIAGEWTRWQWQGMEDRGSPTANHMDHNHLAFREDFTYRGAAGADAVTPAPVHHRTHIVASGETLNKIAVEEHVPGGWRAVYDANAAVIGSNPNMVIPGQSLVLVDTESTHNLRGALPAVP